MKPTLIMLDETNDWQPAIIEKTGRMFTIYLYDADEVTHCCEITPSYYLIPIDWAAEKYVVDTLGDEEAEAFRGNLDEDWRTSTDPIYVHCASIDRIQEIDADGRRRRFVSVNEFEDMEEAEEFFRSNCYLY